MASSSYSRSDAALGNSQNEKDALAKILGRLSINDGVSPTVVDEVTAALQQNLFIDVKPDLARNWAMQLIEDRLKDMRVSKTTPASSPSRYQSPRRTASTRDATGCAASPSTRPPSPKPSPHLPRAFKGTRSQDNRGRSPARSNGARKTNQSRSRTPNKNSFFGSNNNRQSSRSPLRGRSPSLQRLFGGTGSARYEKCPNEAPSPSVYYEAHSTEESLLESRTPRLSERGSQRTLTPSGRPPLAAVNMDPSPTRNIMSPVTQVNSKREATPVAKAATPPTAFSPHQGLGRGSASWFNFDPHGATFSIGTSPAKTKKGSPNRIKSPAHNRGVRATPTKLNVATAQSHHVAAPSNTQPTTLQDNYSMPKPPTPLESGVNSQSLNPAYNPAAAAAAASTTQSFAKMDIGGGNLKTGIAAGGLPFTSPVQPPVDVFAGTGSKDRPPNEQEGNWTEANVMGRRQTAPPQMAFAAASVSAAMANGGPNTPHDPAAASNLQADNVPDTCLNKKTRNTATPLVGTVDPPKFNVDLGAMKPCAKTKVKAKRGINFRKGLSTRSNSTNHIATGLGAIPHIITDDTSPTSASETSSTSNLAFEQAMSQDRSSPSNASTGSEAMSIDSPHPSQTVKNKNMPPSDTQAASASTMQFNIGVGDSRPTTGTRKAGKRRENAPVRGVNQLRSQSMHNVHTSSTFDSNDSSSHPPSSTGSASSGNIFLGPNERPGYGRSFSVMGTNQSAQPGLSEKHEKLKKLREQGNESYNEKSYQKSIEFNTEGIQLFHQRSGQNPPEDFLAILYSNRAAALMMVGAFDAAADDCRRGLDHVSDPTTMCDSTDATLLVKPRLHARMARACLRLGRVEEAAKEFSNAIEWSTKLAKCISRIPDKECLNKLDQVTTDSTLGSAEVNRLREILAKIAEFNEQCINARRVLERKATIDALHDVTMALSIASGSNDLHQMKVKLLADLKRWREVASHSERLAASRVLLDGCFMGDLVSKNPTPFTTPAKYLRNDFFDNAKESDMEEFQKVLNTGAAREAVLRLPYGMIPLYIRSLRLEERYAAAEACLLTLEQFVTENVGAKGRDGLSSTFSWLPREKDKLIRTKTCREKGDEFYQDGKYEAAAEQYATCVLVDFEGNQFSGGAGAGGRLHAVVHCNRAACLMALTRYHEALTECTAAIRIHSGYMKAKLRRARCYSRLERYEEASDEYRRWLEMVRQARNDPDSFCNSTTPCIFDGPHTIGSKEEKAVQQELDDLVKLRAQAQAAERSHAAYQQQREQWQRDRFDTSYTSRNNDAQRRREYFHSHQSSSRRWDSFTDRGPNSNKSGKSKSKAENVNATQSERQVKSPREFADTDSHYDVLQINVNATVSDIKKAYRTLARLYHPDKNSDPTAVENFRRVQLAQEALINPESRRQHDSHLHRRRW